MRKASWILLTIVGALLALGSVGSTAIAYFGQANENMVGKPIAELGFSPEVRTAILARRATAAGFAMAFATLFLFVVTGPYRRGEVWAWWAILVSLLLLNVIVLLRIPILGVDDGSFNALMPLGLSFVALMLDVKRLKRS